MVIIFTGFLSAAASSLYHKIIHVLHVLIFAVLRMYA